MSYQHFIDSLADDEPPADIELALKALWYDANDRDESALRIVEGSADHACRRVRAYLHRKAGEQSAAEMAYWRAGLKPWDGDLESEWRDIVHTVLADRVVANAYS